jgi:hypothetical protein
MKSQQLRLNGAAMRLRAEMNYAREVYEYACLEFDEESQQAHDLGLKTPAGAHTLSNAVVQYQYRFQQYNRAVKRFADFVLAGAVPQESR